LQVPAHPIVGPITQSSADINEHDRQMRGSVCQQGYRRDSDQDMCLINPRLAWNQKICGVI
jgi:hypothetical protein